MMAYRSISETDTERVASAIWQRLSPGDNLLLTGDLGAGKSFLVRCFLRLGGYEGVAPSPTFPIMLRYEIVPPDGEKVPCYHLDLYRIESEEELFYLGVEEVLRNREALVFVEWANKFARFFDAFATKTIAITDEAGGGKTITFSERQARQARH